MNSSCPWACATTMCGLAPKPKGAALHAVLEERETSGSSLGSFHGRRPSRQAAVHPGQHLWLAFTVQHGREERLAHISSKYADGHGPHLEAANGSPIRTYAVWCVELYFGEQRFSSDFVTEKVAVPLIGVDFLCAYELCVTVKGRHLINAVTFGSYTCTLSRPDTIRLASMLSALNEVLCLLAGFLGLTQPIFSSSTTKHGLEHHISTTGPPCQARRLDTAKLTSTKAEFKNLEQLAIIHRSNSP